MYYDFDTSKIWNARSSKPRVRENSKGFVRVILRVAPRVLKHVGHDIEAAMGYVSTEV
jgi:hypothetical protein